MTYVCSRPGSSVLAEAFSPSQALLYDKMIRAQLREKSRSTGPRFVCLAPCHAIRCCCCLFFESPFMKIHRSAAPFCLQTHINAAFNVRAGTAPHTAMLPSCCTQAEKDWSPSALTGVPLRDCTPQKSSIYLGEPSPAR